MNWTRGDAAVSVLNQTPNRVAATIPNGQSLSGVIDLEGQLMTSLRLPNSAGWTTANVTFAVSLDGGATYGDLYKDGSEFVIVVPTGRTNATVFDLLPQDFNSFTHVRVRSGTAALPVAQGGARELQIGRRP